MATLTLNLAESYNAKLLNSRNAFYNLYNITGQYGSMTQVVTMLNKPMGGAVRVNTADSKYEKLTIDHQGVISKIQTRTTSGSNLILDFYDTDYDFFRKDDVVLDNFHVAGLVIAHQPGQITIAPFMFSAFVSANFPADKFARRGWNSSASRKSVGTESLYATPNTIFNYGAIKRDSVFISRRDFSATYMDQAIPEKNWAMRQESVMIARVAQSLEWSNLYEKRGKEVINGEERTANGGLVWAIDNRGGTHETSPNELTESTWKELIELVGKKDAAAKGRLLFAYGKSALAKVQSFTEDFVKQSGTNNTFGGSAVSGIDVNTYSYLGQDIDFMYLSILDDEVMNPEISSLTGKQKSSDSFFLLDLSPVMGDKGKLIPAIERFYFDKEGMRYGFEPGTVGADGDNPTSVVNNGKYLMSNSTDGVSVHCIYDGGIDIANARRMLYWELLS